MRILSLFTILLLAYGCKMSNQAVELEPDEFNRKLSENRVQLIDVRTQEEFNEGHIAGAVNMDVNSKDFEKKAETLYKELPVYIYCKSGNRSSDAGEKLHKLGFTQLVELKGGITGWKKKDLPVTVGFRTAIKGDKLVMVDFNAVWCKPCKMMEPFVKNIETTRSNEVIVFSIDTDIEQAIAIEYEISQLPTFMFFKNGKILDKVIGYMEESKLNELVDKYK